MKSTYALVTAARNEEKYIGNTIESVAAQSILPVQWIIVNDSSTDRTQEIVQKCLIDYPFMSMINLKHRNIRDFASKVNALTIGINALKKEPPADFVGIVDSDITFEPTYYERVLAEFHNNARLGIAGGVLFEVFPSGLKKRNWRKYSVAGGIQLFRRTCFESIGDFLPLPYGSEDSVAEISARMHGWEVQAFRNIVGLHHKPAGKSKRELLRYAFILGKRDYSYGVLFFSEILKCIVRLPDKPFVIQSLFSFLGFLWSLLTREKRVVSPSLIRFYRHEQIRRIGGLFIFFVNRREKSR